RPNKFQAFLRLMMGCDKFCTYCIVPSVRGPEQGRRPEHIVEEARRLVADGVKEITLLGQTVNSYKWVDGDGPTARTTRLADLLYQVHELPGLARIKFITNYPKDMSDDLLHAVRDLPRVSTYLHVPVQSGCDEILTAMKRNYSVGYYKEMLQRIRETVPDSAVSSDFIVGFPGETNASFDKTADLVRESRFKNSFVFKYSPREGTKSYALPDDVADEEKRRRNQVLLGIQNQICLEDNQPYIGKTVEVLVEGPSKTADDDDGPVCQMTGRTHNDRIVVFEGNRRQAGAFLPVRVTTASPMALVGEVVTQELVTLGSGVGRSA
ncbi:MAG: MiaB/RimO family radical SAM methylthiotransferase, partial [Planctomycetia bacterium]